MSCILLLETATKVCSVALSENEKLLSVKESHSANSHSSVITSFISEVINSSGKKNSDIDAVCVSMGPGSYTGLRIGVSTAKGLCYAWNKPLIAINTLQSMAMHFILKNKADDNVLLCPMIDARRMEVYNAIFDAQGNFIRDTSAEIISENSFSELLLKNRIIFFGDGAEKCKEILTKHSNASIVDDLNNSASGMIALASFKFERNQFEDTAYFEPFYLKDFLATKPKKMI
ncbi:MAG TPA: tRNA (adenosine(37)-N6)-threonylcarbamoyltransferase complex dimerization subunit type 1 TsaB [Bacteroidales bacterium]|nr:tRNA (adenosine(37)-N6)-threonylcarbamoyltransferase complex dimerization subunit type 1 TsaB [Bacteroidales bacterium]HPS18136.1 tRNA (adenosine(37)-N6)-threonylcarbamoyltransferase complex dimerization subunit type 1 TsaB [Bacteroidales bacterium]